MAKILIYDNEAKQKILAGVEKLEKAVVTTLGPSGKNVMIDNFGSIHSTKDGVSVASAITLKDPFEEMGAKAIKEVAKKSGDRVGDGTTTSTLLAAEIYRNGLKYISLGSNATQVKNGIKKAAKFTTDYIKSITKKLDGSGDIKRVATVSANGDEQIGNMIADVMSKIGNDGTIKVEDGKGFDMSSNIVEGMVLDSGYTSEWFVTDQSKMEVDLNNPFVLIVNKKISTFMELVPCLQSVANPRSQYSGVPLVIIADDFGDDVTASLVMNKLKGFNCVAIKAPSYGENRSAILQDIATLCGAKVVSDQTGIKIENATVENGIFGQAKRILVTKENSIIFDGCGNKDEVEARASSLRSQIENCKDDYDREKLQERLAKLTSGVGVITVGATTEAERKELRDRVDDAFCASKAALRLGIVAGGGATLLHASSELAKWIETQSLADDEKIGAKILCKSLEAPIKKILENAGIDSAVIVGKLLEQESENCGYNVMTKSIVNMIDDGIIDPTEVVVNEVENAASISGLLLTTEVLIAEDPLKDKCDHSSPSSGCNCMM